MSVAQQTVMPLEVIIADDGSGEPTSQVINQWQGRLGCQLYHVWQNDNGYRRAMAINRALAQAYGEYVVTIDTDIILDQHFIADHLRFARPGFYTSGGRALIGEQLKNSLVARESICVGPLTPGLRHRLNALRLPWLTPLFFNRGHIRGCNLGFWRKDALDINGFDEQFDSYGYEDGDFAARLERNGVERRKLKLAAVEYHLYHQEWTDGSRTDHRAKKLYLENCRKETVVCEKGVKQYI